ncbi:transposase [Nonomuraea sp. SYSU D8015]|uniref:transposase n=1 Tax=Nonomuraea sp. SYSU D8015 TaxID=2593644 RepID=UPI001CB75245|nr:transposase [Nonomuraea sp. SYSU D8015]
MLLVTRESAIQARTGAFNQLKALILTAPEPLRQRLRALKRHALIDACLRLRPSAVADAEERIRRTVMQRLARRIRDLTAEVHAADDELAELVVRHVGHLLQMRGVGVITAAQCWVSWSGPGRFRNEAAFAALAGVNPIEASSGKHTRHRLNPFGDRALNRALHHIALTLERCDPETPRLPGQTHQRRQNPARRHPLSQALPRPQDLPRPRTPATRRAGRLTNIEASRTESARRPAVDGSVPGLQGGDQASAGSRRRPAEAER